MKYKSFLNILPVPTLLLDKRTKDIVFANPAFYKVTNLPPVEGQKFSDLFPQLKSLEDAYLEEVIVGEKKTSVDIKFSSVDKNYILVVVIFPSPEFTANKFQTLYKTLSKINKLTTEATNVVELLEGSVKSLYESGLFEYIAVFPKEGKKPYAEEGKPGGDRKICLNVGDNLYSPYILISKRGDFSREELNLLYEAVHDIAFGLRRLRTEAEKIEALYTDPLTGLPNRNNFVRYMDRTLQLVNSTKKTAALLLLDIDNFGDINQALGHSAADNILIHVAHTIRSLTRKTDMVARIGSDEFAILIVSEQPKEAVLELSKRIRKAFSKPIKINSYSLYISFSGGVSLYPSDTTDLDTLFANATASLQKAKYIGGNTVVFYSEDITRASETSLRFRSDLRRALENREFTLFYQPKVDLKSRKVIGAEALLRWIRNGKVIPPADFLPFVEKSELIHELGLWILKEACSQINKFRQSGIDLPIAVNISPVQLKISSFSGGFPFITAGCRENLSKLEVEITESAIMEDPSRAVDFINTLTSYGIKTYIDDFGTGYSSLSYLKKLPVYAIKIDREFVRDLPIDKDSLEIVKATIALAKAFGLKTVAEGVEKEIQALYLTELGCDYAQGYLFAPPLPAEEFETFVRRGV